MMKDENLAETVPPGKIGGGLFATPPMAKQILEERNQNRNANMDSSMNRSNESLSKAVAQYTMDAKLHAIFEQSAVDESNFRVLAYSESAREMLGLTPQSVPSLERADIFTIGIDVRTFVRELNGYDRVIVYKFHEDEHGKVVAESKRPDLDPYLGLHYPLTDIPQASRLLFKQIYFCLRTGYYDDTLGVARVSRVSQQFTPLLAEWITTGGLVSAETAATASEGCEKILQMVDRVGRPSYDKKKLLLHRIISGSRRLIDQLLRELPTIFSTIEDFLWFMLSAVRDGSGSSYPLGVLNGGVSPYSLEDLHAYLNKFEPSYYTKNGKDPLVYPYVLSIQLLPSVLQLSKDSGDDGCSVDSMHISIVLVDYGVLPEGSGSGRKHGVMDALAEASIIIRQYGAAYLRHGDLLMALEYYVQAAAAVGGGQLSWIARGDGEEGQLGRFLTNGKSRHLFLLEAARRCQNAPSIIFIDEIDSTGLSTDSLADAGYPGAIALGDAVCGMVVAYVTLKEILFWFRSHTGKEIKWGGAKHRPDEKDDGLKMHPHSSFKAFLEVVKSRSHPWENAEIDAIHSLQLILRDSFRSAAASDSKARVQVQAGDLELQEMDELSSLAREMVRLIEIATAPIIAVDVKDHINGWNAKVVELTGLSVEEAMGKSLVHDLFHKELEEIADKLLFHALRNEEDKNVELRLRAYGTETNEKAVFLVVNACCSKDYTNNIVGVCFVGPDVTGQKVMMDKFIHIQGDYKSIIHNSNPLIPHIFASDENTICSEWNATMEKLTGWNRRDMIGKMLVGEIFGSCCRLKGSDALTKFLIALHTAMGGRDIDKMPFNLFDRSGKYVQALLTAKKRDIRLRTSSVWMGGMLRSKKMKKMTVYETCFYFVNVAFVFFKFVASLAFQKQCRSVTYSGYLRIINRIRGYVHKLEKNPGRQNGLGIDIMHALLVHANTCMQKKRG
ncbi:hypothetical protein ACS0TY_000645 [Phlomoides rotata]